MCIQIHWLFLEYPVDWSKTVDSPYKRIKYRNYFSQQYQQFKASDIKGLLQFLRWTNFIFSLVIVFFAFFGAINSTLNLSLNLALLYSFCFLFAGILGLYELHMKKLNERFRKNFGFLFTYIGRSAFIFLYRCLFLFICSISTILFSPQTFFYNILGIATLCDSVMNLFVILVHPAFRRGELKLTDDPSVGYSSGDSVCIWYWYWCIGVEEYYGE